jgi:carboxypeptidase C (cathepsin A)
MIRVSTLLPSLGILCMLAAAQSSTAQEHPAPPVHDGKPPADAPAVPGGAAAAKPSIITSSVTSAAGQQVDYTATTGYMPLNDEQGKLRANVFYIAYVQGIAVQTAATSQAATASVATQPATAPTDFSKRPLTFAFNGGPGAASVWLHLGAAGPRRLEVPGDGTAPAAPYHLVKNEYSWLPATDLVFVDPVNTGYSRAATPDQAKEFLGVREDVAGMAEFIRLYLTKTGRWGSPIFLAGESYGTTRAAGLANYLQERVGVNVSGVILISTVLNFAVLEPGENNDLPFALYLPSYSAVAWYHKKLDMTKHADLDALLKEAQDFADGEYTTALQKGSAFSDAERQAVASKLADLTGLSIRYVLEANLRIQPSRFEKQLLRSPTGLGDLVIGRFDGRITGNPTDAQNDSQEYDPSLSGFYPAYTSAFNEYVRATLKYENELPYEVLSGRVNPWNWRSGTGDEGGFLYVGDSLRDAMTHNPRLKLMVCSGHFDLATPYFATDYQIAHMTLAPDIRKNITQTYYPAGHMIYHVHEGLEKLYKDVTGFIDGVAR